MTSNRDKTANSLVSAALGSGWPLILALGFGCSSSDTAANAAESHTNDSGTPPPAGPEPRLPSVPADCPDFSATGEGVSRTVSVQGKNVSVWAGEKQADKKGPVLFYWHGTGRVAAEISAFMAPMITEIQAEGGIAASFTTTVGTGTTTGNNVWYTGDYDSADIILACAIQQLNIDTHRIYTAGCSAGGLQAGSMALARSSYIAAAMPSSGGTILVNEFEDPTHIPSVITTHGSYDKDFVVLHFADWSKKEDQMVADLGGFAVDCEHAGGHCGAPPDVVAAQWQFLKDHPFGVSKDPYADGLPSSFPSYCTAFSPQ